MNRMNDKLIRDMVRNAEVDLKEKFEKIDENEEIRTGQILSIFRDEGVSYRHFSPTTGYGYDDVGRDTLERIFARLFHTEAALIRPQIACGTAALSLTLFGMTRPNRKIISATGMPYDTLLSVLGIGQKKTPGSLKEMGIGFDCADLKDGHIDVDLVDSMIDDETSLVIAQRSRGYAWRPSLMPEEFKELADMLHRKHPGIPGGGIAPTGGYIAGKKDYIERIAGRLTAPGLGRELGSYAASYRPFYQGLFMAPHTVAQALKTALLIARVFEMLGFETTPSAAEPRADIIQAVKMKTPELLVAFCQGIQTASPVDSMAMPEPWDMPGYDDQVVMAAGTFVAGASIELSADGPIRPPYTAFMQGGLTYSHGRIALSEALRRMMETGALKAL